MRKLFWLAALVLFGATANAQQSHILDPKIDSLFPEHQTNFLTDVTNSVSNPDAVNTRLAQIAAAEKVYLNAVTLPTIRDYRPAEVATEIGRKWRVANHNDSLGTVTRNAGAVILLVMDKHQCFIATAIGTEAYITDGTAGDLCRDARPHFRSGNFGAGIISIANGIASRAHQEAATVATVRPNKPAESYSWTWLWWVFGVLVVGGIFGLIVKFLSDRADERDAQWENKLEQEKQRHIRDYQNLQYQTQDELARQTARADKAERAREKAEKVLADEKEARRWEKLTPAQQRAEKAEKERQRIEAERRAAEVRAREAEAARVRAIQEAENAHKRAIQEEENRRQTEIARKAREEQEEEDRRRRNNYSSYSSDYGSSSGGSSYDSGGSSFGGGSDSFGGGGGGDSW
jgi:uncharacterized membrane protein YgcG